MYTRCSLQLKAMKPTVKFCEVPRWAYDEPWGYVTVLDSDDDCVKGVEGLAKGLKKVDLKYPLVVTVLPGVPERHRRIVEGLGCIVREIEPLYPPQNLTQVDNANPLPGGALPGIDVNSYSILRIWKFVEFRKMIFLGNDIQVYGNIDHLFELKDGHLHAVMDCFCEKAWSHTVQYQIGYCQQCPEKVQWPAEMGEPPALYFNASMFVFEPSLKTYHDLLEKLQVTPPTPFGVQDFLNLYFKTPIYIPLHTVFNLGLPMLWHHPEIVDIVDQVKVVRSSAAGSKLWEGFEKLIKKRSDIYNDESLHYEETGGAPPAA